MKKNLKIMACIMAVSLLSSSCIGSFCMFNKLASWNKSATKSKFLNELLYIVISPAYAVSLVAEGHFTDDNGCQTDDNGAPAHTHIRCALKLCQQTAGQGHQTV